MIQIRTVEETGSTNADLLTAACAGAPEGTWLRAERQSQGRGRTGRGWQSPRGNLYASTIVHVHPGEPTPATLALVTAVALHETAAAWAGTEARRLSIKWPNDLLANGIKLAGVLLEREGDAVVIGLGVNLAEAPSLPDRATIALSALGAAPDPAAFLEDLTQSLARWIARWRGEGLAPIRAAWLAAAHPIGTALQAALGDEKIEGLFEGLDAEGALRLRRADGAIVTIHAGDVFLA
nr:biotin--[acetyl-CoA-carboxylase] ligase [Sphingomonas vulcanisoli]